jgi:hypothetical protein
VATVQHTWTNSTPRWTSVSRHVFTGKLPFKTMVTAYAPNLLRTNSSSANASGNASEARLARLTRERDSSSASVYAAEAVLPGAAQPADPVTLLTAGASDQPPRKARWLAAAWGPLPSDKQQRHTLRGAGSLRPRQQWWQQRQQRRAAASGFVAQGSEPAADMPVLAPATNGPQPRVMTYASSDMWALLFVRQMLLPALRCFAGALLFVVLLD